MITIARWPAKRGDPVAIVKQAGLFGAAANIASPVAITFSPNSVQQNSANGTTVGTARIVSPLPNAQYTGTPVWSLTEPLGIFQINANTGVVTVLDNTTMTVVAHPVVPITISVSGVVPAVPNLVTVIKVTA